MSKTTRSAPTEHPKLGKYEVLREVGRSTTAIVYEGHDPYIDRPVALKMALKRLPNRPRSGRAVSPSVFP